MRRQLTDAEQSAQYLYWINCPEMLPEYSDFEIHNAGFIAGLEYQDKRIEALEAFIAGKITRDELERATK